MKVISKYQCDTCGKIYDDTDVAIECENLHVEPLIIIAAEQLNCGYENFPGILHVRHDADPLAIGIYMFEGIMNNG